MWNPLGQVEPHMVKLPVGTDLQLLDAPFEAAQLAQLYEQVVLEG